jgi:hypothetical protein
MSESDPKAPRVSVDRERYAFTKRPATTRKPAREPKILEDSEAWSFKSRRSDDRY